MLREWDLVCECYRNEMLCKGSKCGVGVQGVRFCVRTDVLCTCRDVV